MPQRADGLDGVAVVAISAGDSHSAALTDDGRVLAVGCFRVCLLPGYRAPTNRCGAQDPQGALGFKHGIKQQPVFTVIYEPAPPAKPVRGKKQADAGDAVGLRPSCHVVSLPTLGGGDRLRHGPPGHPAAEWESADAGVLRPGPAWPHRRTVVVRVYRAAQRQSYCTNAARVGTFARKAASPARTPPSTSS